MAELKISDKNKEKIDEIISDLLRCLDEGTKFPVKTVRGASYSSGAIYVPKKWVGKSFKVYLVPFSETEVELEEIRKEEAKEAKKPKEIPKVKVEDIAKEMKV